MFNIYGRLYIYPKEILDRHNNSKNLWHIYNPNISRFELMNYLLERFVTATKSRGYYIYCLFSAFVCFIYLFIQKKNLGD